MRGKMEKGRLIGNVSRTKTVKVAKSKTKKHGMRRNVKKKRAKISFPEKRRNARSPGAGGKTQEGHR